MMDQGGVSTVVVGECVAVSEGSKRILEELATRRQSWR
jgi:hypothetical protein